MAPKTMKVTLVADRVTKGAIRFMEDTDDDYPINLYLRKEQAEKIGAEIKEGSEIELTIKTL